jgi:methionine-S-sulfoxide reductase
MANSQGFDQKRSFLVLVSSFLISSCLPFLGVCLKSSLAAAAESHNALSGQSGGEPVPQETKLETITLGGGCFWCVEAVFQRLDGVKSVVSGYTGGTTPNPTYQTIKYGGHAEVVQVTFDPEIVSLEQVFVVFLKTHDPTSWHKQGPDIGPQYRSAIFYNSDEQKETAELVIKKLMDEKVYRKPIVTEITKLGTFYRAENYHQNYYNLNKTQSYCQTVVRDKVLKFERLFKEYSVTNKKREEKKKKGSPKKGTELGSGGD